MKSKLFSAALWITLVAVIWFYLSDPGPYRPQQSRTWESFQADAEIGRVGMVRADGDDVEGEPLWADSSVVKVRPVGGGQETLLPKHQVLRVESLGGTEPANPDELGQDPWAGQTPGLA